MIAFERTLIAVLVASVWQGACIVAVTYAVAAMFGRRMNAATKCVLFQIALGAIVVLPIASTLPATLSNVRIGGGPAGTTATIASPFGASPFVVARHLDVAIGDGAVAILAAAWAFVAGSCLVRIGVASLQLNRLVRRSRRAGEWDGVTIRSSPDARTPFAVSFFAPTIVVPERVVDAAEDEFAAIVLHEIAHVRRGDSWPHALECLVRALMFFNPAANVALRAVSIERESACDDWAVARSSDLATYVRAVATFAVSALHRDPPAAYGAPAFGRATMSRIRRLEDTRRNGAVTISITTLGGFLMLTTIIAFGFALYAPAIAFEPAPAVAVVASTACDASVRYLGGPPPSARAAFPPGLRSEIRLVVSSAGHVVSQTIYKSSGNAAFDRSVMTAALNGSWSSKTQGCKAVPGSYVFLARTS